MKKALYPGSFDPITNGHVDIVKRACRQFDQLILGVIHNPAKTPLFSVEERITLIREVFKDQPNITVEGFQGLLVDFAKQQEVFTIVRGLRAVSDFDYEFQMALTNRELCPEVDTVFFMTDIQYAYLSSSVVRQVAQYKGDVRAFLPAPVEAALRKKFGYE
ncbi:MAG: pantetheine-phosphate adenylyltransferase [Candidatus Margulisiibacteriota bacterium]